MNLRRAATLAACAVLAACGPTDAPPRQDPAPAAAPKPVPPKPAPPATPPSAPKHRLTIVFMGEERGRLEPCGCSPGMQGGLARRPARIAASVEPGVPMAIVCGGPLVAGTGDYDRLRMRVILRSLGAMGCAAFAPTRGDLAAGPTALEEMAKEAGVPVVCSNLVHPAADIGRRIRLPTGDVEAYVSGICGASADNQFAGAYPTAALRTLRETCGTAPLVVFADVNETAARVLASETTGPTLLLYVGGRTDPRDEDVIQGGVAIAPLPSRGKFVGFAHLDGEAASAKWTVEYRPVVTELPQDAEIVRLHAEHLEEMRAAGIVTGASRDARFAVVPVPAFGERYAGSDACAECHEEATRTWKASKHTSALGSLRATGDDADPDCVRCHVVGYGTGIGFDGTSATSGLGDVGCEACHGPRAGHAEARNRSERDPAAPTAGVASCLPCHDTEHSADFEFRTHWPRIVHGGK